MKQKLFIICALACLFSSCGKSGKADYAIIPKINEISFYPGADFTLTKNTPIICQVKDDAMRKNAEFLSSYIEEETSIKLNIKENTEDSKNVPCIILDTSLENSNKEAYSININEKTIVINGASKQGLFYGIQSLRKFLPAEDVNKVIFKPTTIKDAPRFSYRGGMLDVSRHFFTVDEVKKYIDILALNNLNTFHFHLTDDQGWRMEIKKYPLLTEVGSKRAQTLIGHANDSIKKYDGTPYSGFYTQEQLKDIVKYAADRYINVLPDIDMPGHMSAALAAYPELGCTDGPFKVAEGWGIFHDVLNPGKEEVFTFLKDILNEVMDVFPSEYIFIGGDECPKEQWENNILCQRKIKSLGLKTDKHSTKEQKLQSYIASFAEEVINARGRKMVGFDEILEGGISKSATIMSWRGMKGGIKAAKLGNNVIMAPTTYVYFDYYQTKHPENEPLAIGGYNPLEKVYSFDPIDSSFTAKEASHVLGAQACVWTEYMPTFSHVEHMILPRYAALSEDVWTNKKNKDYSDFLTRIPHMLSIYDRLGYNYADYILKDLPKK